MSRPVGAAILMHDGTELPFREEGPMHVSYNAQTSLNRGSRSSLTPTEPTVTSLTDYLGILRVRKWLILFVVVLVPAAAVLLSLRQDTLFEATSDVLVTRTDLAANLSGLPARFEDPERFIQTQIDLARIPEVARRTLDASGIPGSPGAFLENSSVSSRSGGDLITFKVKHSDRETASTMATEYARQFTLYRHELDTSAVRRAREEVEKRIAQFQLPPDQTSPLFGSYSELVGRREQLRTMEALQTENAIVVRPAGSASQVQPRPARNGVVAFGLALVLAIGLAFLAHALDSRIRSADEISERLGLNLLGRIPPPHGRGRAKQELAMRSDSQGPVAESFRVLRTNLEFANIDRRAQTIMISSALPGEGKSTTAANLAVAFASAGKRVVLVDLDLRRPILDDLFLLARSPGVTDVVLGRAGLYDALTTVAHSEGGPTAELGTNGRTAASSRGILQVLATGPLPPAPAEFIGTSALAGVIESLRDSFDLVIVDAPPLLHIGDARVLSSYIDGIVVVTRLGSITRASLTELRRVLDASPVTGLGLVVTGAERSDPYRGAYRAESR